VSEVSIWAKLADTGFFMSVRFGEKRCNFVMIAFVPLLKKNGAPHIFSGE
jgi:hypothetical protein